MLLGMCMGKLFKRIIKQIENLKMLKEESTHLHPDVSDTDVWIALIMAEKVSYPTLLFLSIT